VDGDDGRQRLCGIVGIVDIQKIPFAVTAIGNVAALGDSSGQRNGFITLVIVDRSVYVHHNGLKRHL
jgi:hypothetical protein